TISSSDNIHLEVISPMSSHIPPPPRSTLFPYTTLFRSNQFDWSNKAVTDQWEELTKAYPSSGVILLQRDKVSLLDTQLGDLTGETYFEFNLENEDWTRYKGLAYGGITSSSANHRD